MRPFIKWPGGKEHELKYILPNKPQNIRNYVEPFLGGGAVYLAMDMNDITGRCIVNDLSTELIDMYNYVREENQEFFSQLTEIDNNSKHISQVVDKFAGAFIQICNEVRQNEDSDLQFMTSELIGLYPELSELLGNLNVERENYRLIIKNAMIKRIDRMRVLDKEKEVYSDAELKDMFECILKSSLYTHIRNQYNHRNHEHNAFSAAQTAAMFLYIRENCYSAMHRTNAFGEFNVPYGGISYNTHDLAKKSESLKSADLVRRLRETDFHNEDFEVFLRSISRQTSRNDFWFIDPPYDSRFSEYSQNAFTQDDQRRLAAILAKTRAKVMIVIKNTEFIHDLYSQYDVFRINYFSKKYDVNFVNRNDREVEHLIITNYDI